jgi:hypothetical protein
VSRLKKIIERDKAVVQHGVISVVKPDSSMDSEQDKT